MKNRKHNVEFKEMIVGLLNSGISARQISKDYDLHESMISRWKRQYISPNGDFTKKKELSKSELELKALKKELRDITMERDILKKAVSIFSKNDR